MNGGTSSVAPAVNAGPFAKPATHAVATLGSLLWPRTQPATAALLATPGLELLVNARSAIHRACLDVRLRDPVRPRILLPAFHCPSVVTACLAAGLQPNFYRIRPDLSIDLDDLSTKLDGQTGSALIIHFFGISADPEASAMLARAGIRVIEDWSHSFLRADGSGLVGDPGHDRIYSFWKLLPTGQGGGLAWGHGRAPAQSLQHAAFGKEDARQLKGLLEESILHKGPGWLRVAYSTLEQLRLRLKGAQVAARRDMEESVLAEQGERYYPFNAAQASVEMPRWCRRLMATADLPAIAQARSRNFDLYAQRLAASDRFTLLAGHHPDAVPWVFPVRVHDRDQLDRGWRARGVALHTFGIYLHSALFAQADPRTVADARTLARELLCLSVHQDLKPHDIERSCDILAR